MTGNTEEPRSSIERGFPVHSYNKSVRKNYSSRIGKEALEMKKALKSLLLLLATIFFAALQVSHTKAEIKSKAGWNIVCDKQKQCRLYSEILAKNKRVASSYSIIERYVDNLNGPQTVSIILMPLGLHIPSGVIVNIDQKIKIKANLIECKTIGCRAIFGITPKMIKLLQSGSKVTITIRDSNTRKGILLTYSLSNFAKAYKKFKSLNKLAKSN